MSSITSFPTLGDPPFRMDLAEIAKEELRRAIGPAAVFDKEHIIIKRLFRKGTRGYQMQLNGIGVRYNGHENDTELTETIFVFGKAYGWTFFRLSHYWVCSTKMNSIPRKEAKKLNETWGSRIMVNGSTGGEEVVGPVGYYCVDTVEGLQRLVELLGFLWKLRQEVQL